MIAGHSVHAILIAGAVWLAAVAALTFAMRERPQAFPLLAVIALPFRVPLSLEGRTVNLLIPLYAVVAAGALAHLLPRVLKRQSAYLSGRPPMLLDWLLSASVLVYAVQIAYSSDRVKGVENLVFFYIPFLLLYLLLREAPWTRGMVFACFGAAVALAVLFAGVGFVEYGRKQLLLNPKVVAANQYDNYFRVNSLFFDPSIYGRFLALVMLGVTTAVLWTRRRREVLLGAAVLAWLGLAVLAACRWDMRSTAYVAAGLVAIVLVAVLMAPPSLHLGLSGSKGSANNATSGRAKLVTGGLKLFADRPLQGFGSGSFEREYVRHNGVSGAGATSASHTIPVTIAAEQGIAGLALYLTLLVTAFLVLFSDAGRSPPRIVIAACFAALVLHTFIYADFLEDPMTWTLLGIGVALQSAPYRSLPPADTPAARRVPVAG
jgi:O-antigen ligase